MLLSNAAENAQLLDGLMHQSNVTADHVTITVTTWDAWDQLKNLGLLKPDLHLVPLLLWISNAVLRQTLLGRSVSV